MKYFIMIIKKKISIFKNKYINEYIMKLDIKVKIKFIIYNINYPMIIFYNIFKKNDQIINYF